MLWELEMTTPKDLVRAKPAVQKVLKEWERARNDDQFLIWMVQGLDKYLSFEAFKKMMPSETIRRARQKIQNEEGHFLPTEPEVLKQRGLMSEAMRMYMGPNTW